MNEALKHIVNRHLETEGDTFLEIFAGDDMKQKNKPYSTFFDVNNSDIKSIQEEAEIYNTGSYGVFLNINPLCKKKRVKSNIKKISFIFIDLDDAKEEHNKLIKDFLSKIGINYSYNAESGHGFHFLIPVDLETNKELKVKGFLNYLKENCTNKLDIATYDLGRLMRFPESYHNKDKEAKKLKTIELNEVSKENIDKNSEIILDYQLEQKKGFKDTQYFNSIEKKDLFFSSILNNVAKWPEYHKLLDKAKQRNNIFVKNLGFFVNKNPDFNTAAENFLSRWQQVRVNHFKGWVKSGKQNNRNINYYELLKWTEEYSLDDFIGILKQQTKSSFLDKYEFYYLEDEKKESAYLMYYPEKDYYINKSLSEILNNIYYDCIESGLDLVKEFNLDSMKDWDDFPFKKQLNIILNSIHKKIIDEKRIKVVFNINYCPIDEKFINMDNKKFFNIYNKTDLWDYYREDNDYQFMYIKELLMNLCGKSEENYNYFNNWLAWQIQNPTEKLPTAIILQGRQGSGKGTLKTLILDNIFGNNCQEINQTHLESSFNEYLLGKQIIVANEVMHNENRQTLPNVLKNLVTDEKITLNRKFKKEVICYNYTHWIFCTNSENPLRIEEDDRRYTVFYSEKLRKNLGKDIRHNLDYELKEYVSYLKSLKVNFDDVSEPLQTQAKEEIQEINKDSVHRFLEFLAQFNNLYEAFVSVYGHPNFYSVDNSFGDGKEYILTQDFFSFYEKWCYNTGERGIFGKQNFSKRLSTFGCRSQTKRKPGGGVFKMFSLEDINSLVEYKQKNKESKSQSALNIEEYISHNDELIKRLARK